MKYQVGGAVHASTYIGEIEANSPEQAIEKAYNKAHISVCHQCADGIQDPEVSDLWAEDADGNVTRESAEERERAKPLDAWHEGEGDVLWWHFPIVESPYVGSPLDTNFPSYVTHWTRIVAPSAPEGT